MCVEFDEEIEFLSSISSLEQLIPPTRSTYIDINEELFVMKFVIDRQTALLFEKDSEKFKRLNNPGILENTIYGDRYYSDDEEFLVKYNDKFFWLEVNPEKSNYRESFFNYFRVDPMFEIREDLISVSEDYETGFLWMEIPLVCEADWEKIIEELEMQKGATVSS